MKTAYDKGVYYWLISGVFLVAAMVVIGGITRLTQSGLSIVEWKPVVGAIPPLNEQEWLVEFAKYKKTPEFRAYHSHFTLNDFKSIYFWEYLHRLIGRITGLVFLIPFVYFLAKKRLSGKLLKYVGIIFGLGILQGALGWYMVKSGLVKNPHVSHFRLAAHLITALTLIGVIFYTALLVKHNRRVVAGVSKVPSLLKLFVLLLGLQLVYGAFVAGLKAGKMYTTFPKMGNEWIAHDVTASFHYRGAMALLESSSVVQFVHRIVGISLVIVAFAWWTQLFRKQETGLNKTVADFLFVVVVLQVSAGILTLILAVPQTLGVLHQFIAIVLLILAVHNYFLRRFDVSVPQSEYE